MADPVWTMVMFDLPTVTRQEQRAANAYRNLLLDEGFLRVQWSVYAKYFINSTGLARTLIRLKQELPPGGVVRVLKFTDTQWAATLRIENVVGDDPSPEAPPPQLLLF